MVEIKRINIGSAARVGALLYLFIWSFFGIISLLFAGAITSNPEIEAGGSFSLANYLCILVFLPIMGGIIIGLWAFLYNVAARWVGGVKVQISGPLLMDKQGIVDISEP